MNLLIGKVSISKTCISSKHLLATGLPEEPLQSKHEVPLLESLEGLENWPLAFPFLCSNSCSYILNSSIKSGTMRP